MKRRFFLQSAAATLALGAATTQSAPAPIRIGMSAAFQGPSRSLGIELYRGAATYFNEVNQRGGVAGRPIEIVARNDGYQPDPAIRNTIELVKHEQVLLLFGYVGTPTVTRVLPLLKSLRKYVLLFPFTGAQPQREAPYDELVFNLRASYRQETAGLVKGLLSIGCKRIGVFYQIDAYGRSGWDGVRRALGENGLKLTAEATYRRGSAFTLDFNPHVRILREALVDGVICIGTYAPCAGFIRDARQSGWEVPIANLSFVGSESLLGLLAKTSANDATRRLVTSQVVPSYHDLSLPAVRDYRLAMGATHAFPPDSVLGQEATYQALPYSFVSFEGYLNARMVVTGRLPFAPLHKVPASGHPAGPEAGQIPG